MTVLTVANLTEATLSTVSAATDLRIADSSEEFWALDQAMARAITNDQEQDLSRWRSALDDALKALRMAKKVKGPPWAPQTAAIVELSVIVGHRIIEEGRALPGLNERAAYMSEQLLKSATERRHQAVGYGNLAMAEEQRVRAIAAEYGTESGELSLAYTTAADAWAATARPLWLAWTAVAEVRQVRESSSG